MPRFQLHPTGVNNCGSLHLPGGVSPARPAVLFRTLLPCNSSNNNDKRLQKTAATRNAVPSGPQMNEGNIAAWGAGWGATPPAEPAAGAGCFVARSVG